MNEITKYEEIVPAGGCVCICYNNAEIWDSREEAARSFMEGMYYSEGAESERYENVLFDILAGKPVCHDGVSEQVFSVSHGQREMF